MSINIRKGIKYTIPSGTDLDDDLRVIEHLGGSRKVDIYLCRSKSLKKRVACKLLRKDYLDDESSIDSVEREGEILLRMRHPNIIEGYSYELEPVPRIVMQHMGGQNLDTVFFKGNYEAFEIEDIIDVPIQLAHALTYVHSAGLLHLDVKPSNVMYHNGHATLFDFSVARQFTPGDTLKSSSGTTAYKSPEQTVRSYVDYRSDVFGLGVVAYRLLSKGELPYPVISLKSDETSEDSGKRRKKRVANYDVEVPTPNEMNPDVPEAVSDVVMKAIQLEPSDRYATAAEFGRALEQAEGPGDQVVYI